MQALSVSRCSVPYPGRWLPSSLLLSAKSKNGGKKNHKGSRSEGLFRRCHSDGLLAAAMTSPEQPQMVTGLGVPPAPAPGRAAGGHPCRARGCCGHGAPQCCLVTIPRHVTVTRTMPKEPREKNWHETSSFAAGGREQGWCRARSSAGRALPATFHACLLLVFPPAQRTRLQHLLFPILTMPSAAQHLRFPRVSAAPQCPAWEPRIAGGTTVTIPGGILIVTLDPMKSNPLYPLHPLWVTSRGVPAPGSESSSGGRDKWHKDGARALIPTFGDGK